MVLCGAVLALAMPPLCLWPVAFLMLPLLWRAACQAPSWRQAGWFGFCFGMGFYTTSLYWLTNAIMTRLHDFWWVLPFASPGVAVLIAPLVAVPAIMARWPAWESQQRGDAPCPPWRSALLFAAGWTLQDMARTFIFSGFPWNPLGSAFEVPGRVGTILIQPASLVGVDGLTFMLVAFALLFWCGWRWRLALLALALLWVGWGWWRCSHTVSLAVVQPHLVLVQGDVPEEEVLNRSARQLERARQFERYLDLTRQGVQQGVAVPGPHQGGRGGNLVVVWPESAFPGLLDEEPEARSLMSQAAMGHPVLAGSLRRDDKGHWFNSLEAVGQGGTLEALYDKSRLVPFGEYQPWIIPFNLTPAVLTPGPGLQTWNLPEAGKLGPMVCYEVIFSGSVTEPGHRPDWLLTISNDAWYGNSAGPRQHLATGRMRAVEEGLAVAFANNRGPSALYSATGALVGWLPWGHDGVMVKAIPQPLSPTLFSWGGRLLPLALALLACLVALWPWPRLQHGGHT
ncbi:apolipoprotein N-acyltransferase [Formicincola oecophyllae]|uniref:Apolipoprotein N-acyltransferase n=1 Tax=Formicincola oecophyllae TaxID=2558361 RepID=A0A4Y6UCT2_9PROT|nr:apolipoprotein N-acyltransferase [Formicincola oecophyllae]QDH14388.1 apolipoprotein N-acyltransferase [Formicincola oecophyllae]